MNLHLISCTGVEFIEVLEFRFDQDLEICPILERISGSLNTPVVYVTKLGLEFVKIEQLLPLGLA